MKYVLMHKNYPVVALEADDGTGAILRVGEVFEESRIPVGVRVVNGVPDRTDLNEWWRSRAIPEGRDGIEFALGLFNLSTAETLPLGSFGLSLSDPYWIKPEKSDLCWDKVNFFDNEFSGDVGDALLGKSGKGELFDFVSPDNTTDGCLKKRWKISDGKRCLCKSGSKPFMQQPFNEVIASSVAERLGIRHVKYRLSWEEGEPFAVCEDFIDGNTELVSAWRIMKMKKRDNNTSLYRHYVNCCSDLGIDIVKDLDKMMVLDFIIANEDRHQNNFGLVRNADTLEFISSAPLFDSGSSLGFDKLTGQIDSDEGIICKPFRKTHEEQAELVTSFDWVDFSALKGVENDIYSVLSQAGERMDEKRIEAIVNSVLRRIDYLKKNYANLRD